MQNVFHNDRNVVAVDENWLQFLKLRAQESPLRRSRLCLHRKPDDGVHEMIIVMCRDVLFRPHRHRIKTESFHVIEGMLDVVLFDDGGTPQEAIQMGPISSGLHFCYRLSISQFHAVLPQSDLVVVYETTMGPYVEGDAEIAPWSPADPEALQDFLIRSVATARRRNANAVLPLPEERGSAVDTFRGNAPCAGRHHN
jgi:cupin fold WbuC family metalloprotein